VIIAIKTTGPIYNLSKIKASYSNLKPEKEDRIIEISCIEVLDDVATDKVYHQLINPECEVSETASNLHGITSEML
jgi:DNA polymerase-3 subunit epsilon